MNSDKDKIYMQIVIFDEIYNFVVQTFSFEGILRLKNRYRDSMWKRNLFFIYFL
jgi:hypothetical protein